MNNEKYKVIIDTDPGVDDSVCLIYAFADEKIDIQLITTVVGNVSVEKTTRNMLHMLDVFDLDIPVAKGAHKAMERHSQTAEFIHQKEGLGGYVPPIRTVRTFIDEDAVTALYRVISQGDGDIIPIVLGPHTNIGWLIKKHPDVVKKIPKIYFMGGSPFGHPGYPDHISFNISCDPEAFKIVLDSKIPLVMVPSNIGRRKAHLNEEYVNELKNINDVGKLLHDMYSAYWEPGFPDKRVATNDICALFALTHPDMVTTENATVTVNTTDAPGKTLVDFHKDGNVAIMTDIDREKFLSVLDSELYKMNNVKIMFE